MLTGQGQSHKTGLSTLSYQTFPSTILFRSTKYKFKNQRYNKVTNKMTINNTHLYSLFLLEIHSVMYRCFFLLYRK